MNESAIATLTEDRASELVAASTGSRRTLRSRILAFVTALNVVSTIVACAIAYNFQKVGFLHSVDKVLTAGAVSAQNDFGHAYQNRILNSNNADDVSPDEELDDVRRLSELADQLQLKYIARWCAKTASTITPSQARRSMRSKTALMIAFGRNMRTRRRHWPRPSTTGSFASSNTATATATFVPPTCRIDCPAVNASTTSSPLIWGSTISTATSTRRSQKLPLPDVAICVVSLTFTWILANKLAGPLARLAVLIRAVAQHDFRMQPDDRETLSVIAARSHEEVSQVATAFGRMEQRLQGYFVELERSMAEQQRASSELSLAHDIQMGLLPRQLPEIPGCDFFARVIPAKEVGGDLFDVATMDDGRVLLVIADVSGKGISAGLFMAVAKTLLGVARTHGKTAHGVIEFLNNQLSANNDALMFVTMFLAMFDPRTGELAYSNAGHNPPYIRRRDGRLEPLAGRHGPALGIKGGETYACETTTLRDGDLLLLYTDGITEAQDATESLFSETRLEECLRDTSGESAGEAGTAVIDAVAKFQGAAPQFDDITLLALRYTSPVSAPIEAAIA